MRRISITAAALVACLLGAAAPTGAAGAAAPTGAAPTPVHRARLSAGARPQRQPRRQRKRTTVARAAIIGGTLAEDSTFPQLAFIVFKNGKIGLTCTGTVVAPSVVLTAGHCVEDIATGAIYEPSGYTVITGNVQWTAAAHQLSSVSSVLVHPDFNPASFTGDAALLILTTPTTVPAITLASYPSDSARLAAGTVGRIAGWGYTSAGQTATPERLSWATTVVQRTNYCESNAAPFYESSEICTIDPPIDATGICHGDSGGPLIAPSPSGAGDIELGIASHIYGECSTARPSVFTRADLIAPWVNEWIAALTPAPPPLPPPPPTPTPTPAPAPAPQASTTPAGQTLAPAFPPNTPGYYVTRPSRMRKVVVHVAGDGVHIVGLSVKMPLACRHGYSLPLEAAALSDGVNDMITNHTARDIMEVPAGRQSRTGHIGVFLQFTAAGSLEGRLRVQIPYRSRRVGLCAGTLRFTAKT